MKVLFLIGQSEMIGGTEGQLVELAQLLTKVGHPTHVHVVTGRGALTDLMDLKGVAWTAPRRVSFIEFLREHPEIQGHRIAAAITRLRVDHALRTTVRHLRPDLVHAFLPGCIADGLPIVKKIDPTIVRVAGIRGLTPALPEYRSRFHRRHSLHDRMELALRTCDAVVVNSPTLIQSEVRDLNVPEGRVHVISNGLTVPISKSDPSRQPPRAIVIANFHSYKGHDVLVEAVAKAGVDIKIRMCGVGPLAGHILELASKRGVGDMFEIVPPPANVSAELDSAQVGIHPSLTEGFANAILEELAAGLPIICTDVGGARLQVDDGINGLIVPASDVDALAQAIGTLALDPNLRVSMGNESRLRASQFSWEKCRDSHVELYKSLLHR